MEVTIELDNQETIFSNGEKIYGNILLYCPTSVVVTKITASLIGEIELALTDTTGLLVNWKQQEKHRFVQDSRVIVPSRQKQDGSKRDSQTLAFGYHSFEFALTVPESPDCCSCPPNSPVLSSKYDIVEKSNRSLPELPPSMSNLIKGADVSYHIDVAVTTKNIFKTTMKKSTNIKIWPIDKQSRSLMNMFPHAFSCSKTVQASIMAPSTPVPTQNNPREAHLISTISEPAEILISARFLPKFNLTRDRRVAMHLTVEKLNAFSHELHLSSFQMLLVGYTDMKVGTAKNTELSCWTIQSLSNLNMEIMPASEDTHTEHIIDPGLWDDGAKLPEEIVPSFSCCNLSRRYELEISMGFQCRGPNGQAGRVLYVQLRTPVRISSGIFPDRQITSSSGDLLVDEMPIMFQDDVSMHERVQNGFRDQDVPAYDVAGHFLADTPLPPTYDEAILVSMDEKFANERNSNPGGW